MAKRKLINATLIFRQQNDSAARYRSQSTDFLFLFVPSMGQFYGLSVFAIATTRDKVSPVICYVILYDSEIVSTLERTVNMTGTMQIKKVPGIWCVLHVLEKDQSAIQVSGAGPSCALVLYEITDYTLWFSGFRHLD